MTLTYVNEENYYKQARLIDQIALVCDFRNSVKYDGSNDDLRWRLVSCFTVSRFNKREYNNKFVLSKTPKAPFISIHFQNTGIPFRSFPSVAPRCNEPANNGTMLFSNVFFEEKQMVDEEFHLEF